MKTEAGKRQQRHKSACSFAFCNFYEKWNIQLGTYAPSLVSALIYEAAKQSKCHVLYVCNLQIRNIKCKPVPCVCAIDLHNYKADINSNRRNNRFRLYFDTVLQFARCSATTQTSDVNSLWLLYIMDHARGTHVRQSGKTILSSSTIVQKNAWSS